MKKVKNTIKAYINNNLKQFMFDVQFVQIIIGIISYDDLYAQRYEEDYLPRIQDMCITLLERSTKTQTVIITGILQEDADGLYVTNLAVSREEFACTSTPYTGVSFSGTGDLFASAICGYLVTGTPLQEAIDRTVDFLQPAIEEATNNAIPRDFGIPFQKYLSRLIQPALFILNLQIPLLYCSLLQVYAIL